MADLSAGQWAALEQIASLGHAYIVPSKPSARSITQRTAASLVRLGLIDSTGTKVTLTDAGREALQAHRDETGRHPA